MNKMKQCNRNTTGGLNKVRDAIGRRRRYRIGHPLSKEISVIAELQWSRGFNIEEEQGSPKNIWRRTAEKQRQQRGMEELGPSPTNCQGQR